MKITYKELKQDANEQRIKPEGFSDVYNAQQLAKDNERVKSLEKKFGKLALGTGEFSDSEVQEYVTTQFLALDDWFGEEERDEGGEETPFIRGGDGFGKAFLTAKYDDYVNGADVICVAKNRDTDYQPVPFVLDLTYSSDMETVYEKMRRFHTDELLAGFTSIRYFVDDDNITNSPLLEKGGIDILPRFVVGFHRDLSDELIDTLMHGAQFDDTSSSNKAKTLVLAELKNQTTQMMKFFNEEYKNKTPALDKMFSDVQCLDKYFTGAIEVARKKNPSLSPNSDDWGLDDPVARQILFASIY